jgi:hypothetical protein
MSLSLDPTAKPHTYVPDLPPNRQFVVENVPRRFTMSDPSTATDYGDFEDDVGLDAEGKSFIKPRDEWLKMNKGQILRVAFLYFHTYDVNAVNAARSAAKKDGKTVSKEEMAAIGKKALEDRATALSKTVEQLTPIDRLDLTTVHFKKLDGHYQEGLGFVVSRLGKDGAEADSVWKRLPEPKLYFTTLLLVYPTDREGNIDKNGLKNGEWRVIPWRFSKQIYEQIWKQNEGLRENGLSLASQDIKLECKDPQYQKIDVSFVGAAIWQKSDNFRTVVLTKALEFYTKLVPFREMSTDQLRAKLGLGGSAVQDVSGGDFQELLDNV